MTWIFVFFLDSFEASLNGCYRLRVRPVPGLEQNISQPCSGYLQWNIASHRESGRKWFREGLELLEGNSINADAWERWSNTGKMEGPFNCICLPCNSFSSLTGLTPEELRYTLKKLKQMWESFLKQCCTSMAGPKGCISLKRCSWKQHWLISQIVTWRW